MYELKKLLQFSQPTQQASQKESVSPAQSSAENNPPSLAKVGSSAPFHQPSSEIKDFIAKCVGLLLQLRRAAERAHALTSAEISSLFESALTPLRPSSLENLHIFKEIEASMANLQATLCLAFPNR